ncbi:MAG: SDR family oxidoreductase [Acidimicrobiales bacterium]
MNYLVTGGTGFIGRFVVARLLARRDAQVHVIVRPSSLGKFEALRGRFPDAADRLHAVIGDIADDAVIGADERARLAGTVDHLFHLAAVYDMSMDDATGDRVNLEGTRHVVHLANELGGGIRLHHVSSVAVAGDAYSGSFTEAMFDEGQRLDHPYFRTKFAAEKIVRDESSVPFRIYRPGVVVGSSETGEMDKVDGPYYAFPLVKRISARIPRWLPLVFVEGGRVPIAPVDYVAAGIDAIAHRPDLDGRCFHLLQSESPTLGDLFQIFLDAGQGPAVARKLDLPVASVLRPVLRATEALDDRLAIDVEKLVARATGIPLALASYATNPAVFDDREARRVLDGAGISCPDLRDYAPKLWRYWELHLEPVRIPRELPRKIGGKVVLITGASSGIGLETARKVGAAGAKTILVSRTEETLEEVRLLIEEAGGEAYVYPCDLSDMGSIDAMADKVLADFGHVDIIVNNAGRSIRRAVVESLDRFHDVERTMQLNYFGAVRLIMKLLPSMIERRSGHIINVSSIGVQANAPRFSAYVASKAALDAFGRCLSAEVRGSNVDITTVYMPLVRTPMIAPTTIYRYFPAWTPDDAGTTIAKAMIDRPKSVTTPLGRVASISYAIWPKVNDFVLNQGFRLFPTSAAARGERDRRAVGDDKPTVEQLVFANVFRGEHW